MDTNKKNKIIVVCLMFVTIIVLVGITYTFFSSAVSNTNNEKFSTQTATMSLVFDDDDNGINATLNPGESVVKKFSIENTGTVDAYGKINWVDLVNTYTNGSLTWKLESSNSKNGTYTKIKEDKVPISSTQTTVLLKDGLLVPEGDTLYYKLTITLNNLDEIDQTNDLNASMHSKFSLQSGKATMTAVEYIKNLAKNGNQNSIEQFASATESVYVLNFNNTVLNWYQDESICEDSIIDFKREYGDNIDATCVLNSSTNKYDVVVNGDTSGNSSFRYETLQKCEDDLESYLDFFENTTCIKVSDTCGYFAYDGTVDNNLRYVGANPCNNVRVNGMDFKILGVMNNVDNGLNVLESRLKLVFYSGNGEFSWGQTNNFDNSSTKNIIIASSDQNNCLINSPEIDNARWYLRGISTEETSTLAKDLYNIERTTGSVFPGNPTSSIAKSAPLYPSDVVLASAGSEVNRTNCLNKNVLVQSYDTTSDYTSCTRDNWVFGGDYNSFHGWTIMPASNNDSYVLRLLRDADLYFDLSSGDPYYASSIYLSSDAEIIGGVGTYDDPYVIGTKNCNPYG